MIRRFSASRTSLGVLICAVTSVAVLGCGEPPPSRPPSSAVTQRPPWFANVTDNLGLDFNHDPGPVDGKYFMPQINGSGAALFDFDNDGKLDIYLLQCGGPNASSKNQLYRQLPSGKLQNVSAGSGIDINGYNMGVTIGDVNNDGWLDIVVTQYLGIKLFLNRHDGKFEDATDLAGLKNPYWGASASFVDYDRDGWLDLVVVNYLEYEEIRHCVSRGGKRDYCLPSIFQGTPTCLWRNRGSNEPEKWLGFEDRTQAAGLAARPSSGMTALCADFTGDGWPDIFITNDIKANHLWTNQHNGTFVEEAVVRGVAYNSRGTAESNMGVAFGDVDGDSLPDLFVTHFTNEHHGLWKQKPRGSFLEQTIASGLTRGHWHGTGWGAALADFDQNGGLDVALVNGYVRRRDAPTGSYWSDYMDRNQVFSNDGAGQFQDISEDNPALCGVPNVGRGLCVGDFDNDGALDLLVTQIGGRALMLRNVAQDRGHWLQVRAVDTRLKRDAIGAEIYVNAGQRRWFGLIQPAYSYQCSNDFRAHFGLGSVARVDSLEVLWPDGSAEQFSCPAVDCEMVVERGTGRAVEFEKVRP